MLKVVKKFELNPAKFCGVITDGAPSITGKTNRFITNFSNVLAFLTDFSQHISDLNLNLQGKGQLLNKMFEHICAFEKKMVFQVQLSKRILTHFKCLTTRKLEFSDLNCTNYGASVQKLSEEFANRFRDFR